MKEIQTIVRNYMLDRNKQKKYLAIFLVLAMLVSLAVSLGLMQPADSMTFDSSPLAAYINGSSAKTASYDVTNVYGAEANNGWSPASLTEAELLIGRYDSESGYENRIEWADGLNTAEEVIEAAKRKYFLGIASDFCVFLQGDFNPSGADCEGRVAVGGNIVFDANDDDSISNDYNYQLGSGDFITMTALINTDNYLGVKEFAHAIVGGYIQSINTLSAVDGTSDQSKWYERTDSNELLKSTDKRSVFFPEDEDRYKRFVVGTNKDITECKHMTWPSSTGWTATLASYSDGCEHDPFDGNNQPKLNELASFYQRDMINFGEVFEWIGTQSEKLAKKTAVEGVISGNTVTFDGSSYPAGTKTYYFSLPAWDNSIRTVKFINVDETANFVVNCGGGGEEDSVKPVFSDSGQYFSTYINDTCISKFTESGSENYDSDNEKVGNNYKPSEQILYNFYEATDVEISAHLNGTVLAPGAAVTSDKVSSAHLSGSLIAQTFTGALEFGYRPYRGGTDILGSTAGYVVPFNKIIAGSDMDYLEGAKFVIKDEQLNTVESWISEDGTKYISIPTEIDFEGGKTYDGTNNQISHTYTVTEESAPEGFVTTGDSFTIVINETIDVSEGALLRTESGTIPTRVWVTLELWDGDTSTGTNLGMRNVLIRDAYSDAGIVQRIVSIQNGTEIEHFILNINPTDGSINSVGQPTDEAVIAELDAGFSQVAPSQDADIDVTLNVDSPDVLEGEETSESTEETDTTYKIMCVGDSITDGYINQDNGYRKYLCYYLQREGIAYDMVGSKNSHTDTATYDWDGTTITYDPGHEGYSYYAIQAYNGRAGIYEQLFGSSNSIETYNPDMILLMIGTNDLIDARLEKTTNVDTVTDSTTALERLETLVNKILESSDANDTLFLASVPRISTTSGYLSPYGYILGVDTSDTEALQAAVDEAVATYNAGVKALAEAKKEAGYNVEFVDINSVVAVTDDDATDELYDGCHPNEAGYEDMGLLFADSISAYIAGDETTGEDTEPEVTTTAATTIAETTTTTATTEDPRETPDVTAPVVSTAVYGDLLSTVTLPAADDNGSWAWESTDENQTVGNAGTNTFNAVYTPTAITTYKPVTVEVQVTVEKADPAYTVPTGLTAAYGNTLASVTLPSGWTWSDSSLSVGNAGETNSFDAVFTPADTANYNTITASVAVTVSKAQPTVNPVLSGDVYTQGDTLPEISTSEGDTAGTIAWLTGVSQLVAGENILTWEFTPEDTNNYEIVSGTTVIMAQTTTTTTTTIATNTIAIADKKTATVVTVGDGDSAVKYYYDPASMMIMPLPDKTPTFENEYGLVFKKLDDEGNLLPGAQIELQSGTITNGAPGEFTAVGTDLWKWGDSSSSYTVPIGLINVSDLETGTVYRFYEAAPPDVTLYETAPPIYFIKTGDLEVIYIADETVLGDTSKWEKLNLKENREITMTDHGIYGAKVTLSKTDSATWTQKLDGAEFELYALDGNESVLVYPLPDGNYSSVMDDHNHNHPEDMYFKFEYGSVDLYEFFKSADPTTYNSDYVQGGYLVPDTTYYLNEVKAPNGYIAATGEFYFTIETDEENGGYKITTNKIETVDAVQISIQQDSSNGDKQWWLCDANGNRMNQDNWSGSIGIANVTSVIVKSSMQPTVYTNSGVNFSWSYDSALGAYVSTFSSPVNISKFEVQSGSWTSINVEYVQMQDSDGVIYSTDPSAVGPVVPDDYTITEMSLLSIPPAILISVQQDSGNGDKQWWVYDANGNQMNKDNWDGNTGITNVTSVSVKSSMQPTVYTNGGVNFNWTYDSASGAYVSDFSSPVNISKFELQSGSWTSINVEAIEFTTSDGVVYTTNAQKVADSAAQTGKPDLSISALKIHYLNGNTVEITEPIVAGDTAVDSAYPFDISAIENKDSIIGMEVTLTGDGKGNIQIGDAWTITGAAAGTYTVGDMTYTPPVEEGTGTDNTHLVQVEGMNVKIGNEKMGKYTQIEVVKNWSGDASFTEYRPESITVQLWRAEDVDHQINPEMVQEVTLSASEDATKNWRYTWTGLDGLLPDATIDNPEYYYYYIKEINAPTGYTVSYSNNNITSGPITITNKFETISLEVEKSWVIPSGTAGITTPEIEVQLQKKNGENWENIEGMTLKLNEDNEWRGEFTGLPDGETYKAVELDVPAGWTSTESAEATEDGKLLTIKNTLDTGELSVEKLWSGINESASDRPAQVVLNLYRSIYAPGETVTTTTTTTTTTTATTSTTKRTTAAIESEPVETKPPESEADESVTQDYARLLQYSLYFYDANMCGDEVGETSVLAWRDDCHDESGEAVLGGYHDAGDHVMFGLPHGFTSSTLGWTYYEYSNTFKKLGLIDHYKVIMKHFCDFYVDATTLENGVATQVLIQKGQGGEGNDHSYWGAPELQSINAWNRTYTYMNRTNSKAGSEIAAQYAATLAQYARNFSDDPDSETYLQYAEALYKLSVDNNTSYTVSQYASTGITDEQAWAAAWLYLITGDEYYKTECETKLATFDESASSRDMRGYFWDDVELGASLVYNAHIAETPDWDMVSNYLSTYATGTSYVELNGWGSARHNTLLQLVALAYDKNNGSTTYQSWAQGQMSYLLGNNSIASNGNSSTCFVVGFADNSATSPHHRAASNLTVASDWSNYNSWNGSYSNIEGSHTLVGALVGGPSGGSYSDDAKNSTSNEVTLDYNAGLVGAAAALYDVYGTGNTVTQEVMVADGLELREGRTIYETGTATAATAAASLAAFALNLDTVDVMADEPISVTGNVNGSGYMTIPSGSKQISSFRIRIDQSSFTSSDTTIRPYVLIGSWSVFGGIDCYADGTSAKQEGNFSSITVAKDASSGDILVTFVVSTTPDSKGILVGINDGSANMTVSGYEVTYSDGTTLTYGTLAVPTGPSISLTGAPDAAKLIGETVQLTATDSSGTLDIQWKSSNESLATVDSTGKVTIVGAGADNNKVTITAYDKTDNSISASAEINITPMTITLDDSSIAVGDAANVTFNNKLDSLNQISYSFTPTTGLTAIGNQIIAQAAGNYTVNVTATDGTSTATASAQLTVDPLTITGSANSITVKGGTVTYSVNGSQSNLVWESLTPDLLTIDASSGVATAIKSGPAKIQVTKTGADGETYTAELEVTVNKAQFSISVDKNQIRVDDTLTISAHETEGGTVTYSSTNESVATVDANGIITAVGVGSARITGTLGTESSYVDIEVKAAPVISDENEGTTIGYISIGNSITVEAANILGSASWSIVSGDNIVSITPSADGKSAAITGLANGEATIKVTDSDGASDTYDIVVTIVNEDPTDDFPTYVGGGTQVQLVQKIYLNSENDWKEAVENLPKTDGNGNTYYYYIAELDNSGGIATEIQGSNAVYIPVNYENNGSTLDDNKVLSVENYLKEKVEGGVSMPATGGEGSDNFYIFGMAIILTGMAGFIVTKRRKGKRCSE